jgi:large subunit ribosomal protein L4
MATKTAMKRLSLDLPAEIFDVQVNIPLIHQVVVAQQAAARQGTHATKTRGEVRGGGRKPYRQKGTGRARQGSIRAPQYAGGGIVHGPQPRSYDQRTPKKMKAAALRGALSDRARNERIHVVDGLVQGDTPSTKAALRALAELTDRNRFLVVLERTDAITWLSLRNAQEVHIVAVDQLNTYDVLDSDDVVFTKGAYDEFVARQGKGGTPVAKAETTETKAEPATEATTEAPAEDKVEAKVEAKAADDAADEAVELPKGAKAPLKSPRAPKGYEVLADQAAGVYRLPEDEGYDPSAASFWFKSVEDAEAAGFTPAAESEGDK